MAESPVPQAPHAAAAFSANGATEPTGASDPRRPAVPPLILLWAAIAAGLGVYIALGIVSVRAGVWFGRRMSVRQIWLGFLDYLATLGAHPLLVAAVALAAGFATLAAVYALWLAFTLRDAPGDESP